MNYYRCHLTIFFILFIFLPFNTQGQDECFKNLIKEGNGFLSKKDYRSAINKYLSSLYCASTSPSQVDNSIKKAQDAWVKELVEARQTAERGSRAADNLDFAFSSKDQTLALRVLQYNMKKHPKNKVSRYSFFDLLGDPNTLTYQLSFLAHDEGVTDLAISPLDGKYLLTTGGNTARLWEASSGKLVSELPTQTGKITCLAFLPDGKKLVTGSQDGVVKMWNIQNGFQQIWEIKESDCSISALAITTDGKKIAYATNGTKKSSMAGYLNIIHLLTESGSKTATFKNKNGEATKAIAFSKDGSKIATGCGEAGSVLRPQMVGVNFPVYIWNLNDLTTPVAEHSISSFEITSLAFAPDNKNILLSSANRMVHLWNFSTKRDTFDLTGHALGVNSVEISPDGKYILTAGSDKKAILWDYASREVIKVFYGHSKPVSRAVFSPDGKTIFTAGLDGVLKSWRLSPLNPLLKSCSGHTSAVNEVVFSHNGLLVASASRDNTIKIWKAETGALVWTLTGHAQAVNCLSFSYDNAQLISGSLDASVKLWNLQTGREIKTFSGQNTSVNRVAFSQDKTKIVATFQGGLIKVWNISTGKEIITLNSSIQTVKSMAFPSQQLLAICGGNGGIEIWDMGAGIKKGSYTPAKSGLYSVKSDKLSQDGRYLLTNEDYMASLWNIQDINNPMLVHTFSNDARISSLAMTPDGARVLIGYHNHTSVLWDADSGNLLRVYGQPNLKAPKATPPLEMRQVAEPQQSSRQRFQNPFSRGRTQGPHSEKITQSPNIELPENDKGNSGHKGPVNTIAISPDGQTFVSGSEDGTIIQWCIELDCNGVGTDAYFFSLKELKDAGIKLEPEDEQK